MAGIGDQLKSAGKSVSKFAQKATSSVNDWWGEVNAINERRAEVRDLARERDKTLVEMGTKVYTLHRHGKVQNKDLLSDCERIDDIGERIERLEHEIAELKQKSDQAQPRQVEVADDSSVVADEDVDVTTAEAAAEASVGVEPEVEKEATVPCAHAEAAAEGPAEGDESEAPAECEGDEAPSMEPVPGPEAQPETELEAGMPEAHAQEPTEGPADEAGAVDTAGTDVEGVAPEFDAAPHGDASEPEVESEDSPQCAHAGAAAEGPADENEDDRKPGCED